MEKLAALFSSIRNIRAPEFMEGLDWINAAEPISMEALHGKFVLLDFWTFG